MIFYSIVPPSPIINPPEVSLKANAVSVFRFRHFSRRARAIIKPVKAMTIYLDVLLLSNLWADYALLRTAAALTHTPVRAGRMLLAAVLGAAESLCVLLPPLPLAVCVAGRILLALLLCAVCCGRKNLRAAPRLCGAFLGLSAVFCGAVYALAALKTPVGWYTQNTFIYADISLLTLLLGTAAAAALTTWRARRAAETLHRSCRLHLRLNGKDFLLPALADTGSTLRDAFSGKPVIVCGTDALRPWLGGFPDAAAAAASAKGFRMLPVQTVAGTKLLPAFFPDYAAVRTENGAERQIDVLLALSDLPAAPAVIPAFVLA